MSQFDFGAMDPDLIDGTELANILNQFRDALLSAHKGPSAPTYAKVGMGWIDDSATPWSLKRCTAVTPSVAWVVTGYINPTGPTFTLNIANVTGLQTALDGKLGVSAQAADSDKLDGMQPATAATASTIAQRDASGNLTAVLFSGTATAARYA